MTRSRQRENGPAMPAIAPAIAAPDVPLQDCTAMTPREPEKETAMAVVFWEAVNGEQDGWPISTEVSKSYDLTQSGQPVPNNEASSCSLVDVEAGTIIEVYNHNEGKTEDGYTTIKVLNNIIGPMIIGSFQTDQIAPDYVVDYNGQGEVNGKVSLIKITAG
jgi:hypothetical protein